LFKNNLIDVLKNRKSKKCEAEISEATGKIVNQKRLSSKEFLEGYDAIWKEGPPVKYQNIGSREMVSRSTNQNQTLW
jgi:hypothetical protein